MDSFRCKKFEFSFIVFYVSFVEENEKVEVIQLSILSSTRKKKKKILVLFNFHFTKYFVLVFDERLGLNVVKLKLLLKYASVVHIYEHLHILMDILVIK